MDSLLEQSSQVPSSISNSLSSAQFANTAWLQTSQSSLQQSFSLYKMNKPKIIDRGAEAVIYEENKDIKKERTKKSYRHPELDKKIIKRRTKAETKILKKAKEIINVPEVHASKQQETIHMQKIEGEKLSTSLDAYPLKQQKEIIKQIANQTAKLHQAGIIHGDLTTSNMILKNNQIYFIDFGLGFLNGKYEDKGIDIHLFKQALEAKHFKHHEELFKVFEEEYKKLEPKEAQKVFERLIKIEKRGRYRH